ncbi:MAG: CcmD family protein [Acidobacteria bacterium]|nr:CcmD family protein [Acidobacteriota bacterium]
MKMKSRVSILIVMLVVFGAMTLSAQQPGSSTPPDGFVPVNAAPQVDQLPAAPMVIAAYAFVWVALVVYVWFLWRRLAKVERELADLNRRIQTR